MHYYCHSTARSQRAGLFRFKETLQALCKRLISYSVLGLGFFAFYLGRGALWRLPNPWAEFAISFSALLLRCTLALLVCAAVAIVLLPVDDFDDRVINSMVIAQCRLEIRHPSRHVTTCY